jgi:hypothetical protein
MAIWGHRDSEPAAEEMPEGESTAPADETTAPAEPEHQAGEPAPAFWRAQGEAPEPAERAPEDAPPLAHEQQAPAGPPAPPVTGSPAGTDVPPPVLTEDIVVLDEETAVQEPALAGAAGNQPGPGEEEAPVPSATAIPAAGAGTAPATPGGVSPERWSEILATFVDDPRGAVKMAQDTVDAAIDEFVTSVRARQQDLESSWHSTETDTERLRVALRDYRRLWHQVRELDLPGNPG